MFAWRIDLTARELSLPDPSSAVGLLILSWWLYLTVGQLPFSNPSLRSRLANVYLVA